MEAAFPPRTFARGFHAEKLMTMRVLLADDERDFVDTLAERLSLRGYEVTTVHNGAEAVRAATSARPDVAVLDLFMPGLPGDETLRQLKVMYPDLPVILLTGHEAVDDNGTSPVAKAFACLTKPLAFKDFVAVLEAAARAGRQASEGGEDGQ